MSLILAPWNYPLFLTLAPLVSAIAAGCTAVVKPGRTPASARALAEVLGRVFPPEYITVAEGDGRRRRPWWTSPSTGSSSPAVRRWGKRSWPRRRSTSPLPPWSWGAGRR